MFILKTRTSELKAKAVAFDKDGTLTEGLKVWKKIFSKQMEIASSMGLKIENEARKIFGVDFESQSTPLAIAYASEEITLLAASIWLNHNFPWDECRKLSKEIVKTAVKKMSDDEIFIPTKGAKEALTFISQQVPTAIATSDSKSNVDRLLKKWKMENHVNFVITSQDVNAGKPAPDMLYEICKAFDIECAELIMIGDNKVDVEMARNAGAKSIIVGQKSLSADGWVENLGELMSID